MTVVVCTFNRAALLRNCLASLDRQNCAAVAYEVVVVDNNSTDDTSAVAASACMEHSNFRMVVERRQGLSHARNRGWSEAHGAYVAFIDDDARALPDWVERIRAFFAAHPEAAAAGGPYRRYALEPLPAWFPPEYGEWDLGPETQVLSQDEFLNGTNMVFRRDVLEALEGFDTGLGMRGGSLAYAEETELMMRMRDQGHRVYYCPDIVVEHAVLGYKMRLGWLLRSSFANGRSGVKAVGDRKGDTWSKYFAQLLKGAVVAMKRFLFSKEQYFRTRTYRAFAPFMWQLGYFVSLVRRR